MDQMTTETQLLSSREQSEALHEEFTVWWAVNGPSAIARSPHIPEHQVELSAWNKFKRQKQHQEKNKP